MAKRGRPPRPEVPKRGLGPKRALQAMIRDVNTGRRDKIQAINSLFLQEERERRANRVPVAEAALEHARTAGWFSHFHIGWDDGTPPDHPHFGLNMLAADEDRRDPKTGAQLGPVPEWYRKLRSFHLPWWPDGPKPELWWRTFTPAQWAVVVEETEAEWLARRDKPVPTRR